MAGVLQQGHALIGDVEEDDRRAKNTAGANHLRVQNVRYPYEQEDEHLLEDAPEANRAGELFVYHGAHDTGDVVDDHESNQSIEQAVTPS